MVVMKQALVHRGENINSWYKYLTCFKTQNAS